MKENKFEKYIWWGLTAFCVIAASIATAFIFNRFDVIKAGFLNLTSILMPIIYGAVLSFLVSPVYNKSEALCLKILERFLKKETAKTLSRGIATVVCLIFLVSIVTALVWMLIPQIIKNVTDMLKSLPDNLNNMSVTLEKLLADNPDIEATVLDYYSKLSTEANTWLTSSFLPNINTYIMNFSNRIIGFVSVLFNVVIGLIVMMYLLNMKKSLATQAKKMIYAFTSLSLANAIINECRYVQMVFSKFIVGKIIDSVIIGIINYVFMSLINMPYALLISVVVGVTNVVPFFGPFIGAIPSALILLLVSPVRFVQFIVWILVLQQVDGNIIGPRILGQTTGLPSFWILFSILLFGGLFGIAGMIIGVPTWAVVYRFIKNRTDAMLMKKNLSAESGDYISLDYIDGDSGDYVKIREKE